MTLVQAIDHNRHAVLMTLLDAYPLVQVGGAGREQCSGAGLSMVAALTNCAGDSHHLDWWCGVLGLRRGHS